MAKARKGNEGGGIGIPSIPPLPPLTSTSQITFPTEGEIPLGAHRCCCCRHRRGESRLPLIFTFWGPTDRPKRSHTQSRETIIRLGPNSPNFKVDRTAQSAFLRTFDCSECGIFSMKYSTRVIHIHGVASLGGGSQYIRVSKSSYVTK